MSFWEHLKKLMLYAGVDKEDFYRCQPYVRASNGKRLTAFLAIACGFFVSMTIAACLVPMLRYEIDIFAVALLFSIALLALDRAVPQKHGLLLLWEIYAFEALLYILGIYLGTVQSPGERSCVFLVFLVCVPVLFAIPPLLNITNVLLFDGFFLWSVVRFKQPEVAAMDICNGIVFGGMSVILSAFMMTTMYENFVARSKLAMVAENDLTVGLFNRNAYEKHLRDYPLLCANSLSCVYIDANGLHELNNSMGHDVGDKMLRLVAWAIREVFGDEHSYRVGGDEFVVFVLDKPDAELRVLVDKLDELVTEAGYSIAVGIAAHSAGGIDIDELVNLAEQRMYQDKREHYRALHLRNYI